MEQINTVDYDNTPIGRLFRDCGNGQDGTPLDAQFMNGLMMEMANVIAKSCQTQIPFDKNNPASYDQLWQAMQGVGNRRDDFVVEYMASGGYGTAFDGIQVDGSMASGDGDRRIEFLPYNDVTYPLLDAPWITFKDTHSGVIDDIELIETGGFVRLGFKTGCGWRWAVQKIDPCCNQSKTVCGYRKELTREYMRVTSIDSMRAEAGEVINITFVGPDTGAAGHVKITALDQAIPVRPTPLLGNYYVSLLETNPDHTKLNIDYTTVGLGNLKSHNGCSLKDGKIIPRLGDVDARNMPPYLGSCVTLESGVWEFSDDGQGNSTQAGTTYCANAPAAYPSAPNMLFEGDLGYALGATSKLSVDKVSGEAIAIFFAHEYREPVDVVLRNGAFVSAIAANGESLTKFQVYY